MSRRPDFSQHQSDPRFDDYRDRVGRLYRGQDEVGLVLGVVAPHAENTSGHLWWRRWGGTFDLLGFWTVVDGRFSDDLLPNDASEEELSRLDRGQFSHYGEDLRVEWLNQNESARLRLLEFGR